MIARSSSNPKHHPQQGSTAVRSQGWAARRALARLLLICASFMLKALSSCLLSANAGSSFLLWGHKCAISQGVSLAPLLSIYIFVGCSSGGDIAKRAALRADCPPSDPARPSRISAEAHRRFQERLLNTCVDREKVCVAFVQEHRQPCLCRALRRVIAGFMGAWLWLLCVGDGRSR